MIYKESFEKEEFKDKMEETKEREGKKISR